MNNFNFNRATHFSIVWGVMLAFLTLLEWRGLDRDPLNQQILSPFIERDVTVSVREPAGYNELDFNDGASREEPPDSALQYEVEINFNGPLFLACFFAPVLVFHGIGWLVARIKRE